MILLWHVRLPVCQSSVGRSIILVSSHMHPTVSLSISISVRALRKFQGVPLRRVLNTRGGKIFANIPFVSETVRDRPIVSAEQ